MSTPTSPFHHSSFAGIIGVGVEDITPPVGIFARNWGAAALDVASGVHRPLWCKVLTLQDLSNNSPFVLASLDLGWWKTREDEWLVRGALIEELGLDETRVLRFWLKRGHFSSRASKPLAPCASKAQ